MFLLNRCYSLSDFWNVLSKLHIRKRRLRIIIVFPTYIRAFEIRDLSKNKNRQEDPFCQVPDKNGETQVATYSLCASFIHARAVFRAQVFISQSLLFQNIQNRENE
jgi:hypothetical protein